MAREHLRNSYPNRTCITVRKWFEPKGISYFFGVIVRVQVAFRKTVVGD